MCCTQHSRLDMKNSPTLNTADIISQINKYRHTFHITFYYVYLNHFFFLTDPKFINECINKFNQTNGSQHFYHTFIL